MKENNFVAFILTHGRPDNVYTYSTLRNQGYTGKIVLIVDNEDSKQEEYKKRYGDEVYVFDKLAVSKTFDNFDTFGDRRAIVYARNVCFQVAEELGFKYFIQLDDDYTNFNYRYDSKLHYKYKTIDNVDGMFDTLLDFYKNTTIDSIAITQGGDFIGGMNGSNPTVKKIFLSRKCMNSFICSTERPFQFVGRINEDVNTYVNKASTGKMFFTYNLFSLQQKQTQSNSGGMTDIYLDRGTYNKSFYTIICSPSSVKIAEMGNTNKRLHHRVYWKNAVPVILNEKHKKK